MPTDNPAANASTHHSIATRYGYHCNHLYIANQATGAANAKESSTSIRKSLLNNVAIPATEAPNTFLTPISLIRFSAIYVANPNNPRQEINTVSPANNPASVPVRFSSSNFWA